MVSPARNGVKPTKSFSPVQHEGLRRARALRRRATTSGGALKVLDDTHAAPKEAQSSTRRCSPFPPTGAKESRGENICSVPPWKMARSGVQAFGTKVKLSSREVHNFGAPGLRIEGKTQPLGSIRRVKPSPLRENEVKTVSLIRSVANEAEVRVRRDIV
jgi:hypothetical protein